MLKKLVDENPKKRAETLAVYGARILALFAPRIYGAPPGAAIPKGIYAVIEYWFTNNFRALMGVSRHIRTAEEKAAQAAEVERLKAQFRAVVLLELMMPNGKTLRDCSANECRGFQGWFQRIAIRLTGFESPQSRQYGGRLVGDYLSEADLMELKLERF